MKESWKRSPRRVIGVLVVLLSTALLATAAFRHLFSVQPTDPPEPVADISTQVQDFCAACHAYPPPESFPRSVWVKEVAQGFQFARQFRPDLPAPPIEQVIEYYQSRAPEALSLPEIRKTSTPLPIDFRPIGDGQGRENHAVANVNLVRLSHPRRLDVLVCDMRANVVKVLRPYQSTSRWEELAYVPHPAHSEVVDLDGDGIKDVLVACLGDFHPTDRRCGEVLWLRGDSSGRFTPVSLLQGVGRVADVRAADFDSDGDLDLIVAEFGWRQLGNIVLLENRTTDWTKPVFAPRIIDPRHGTINVPVADLNGDGKPDFVALISQEHETIVAFINEGNLRFRLQVIYTAAHPAYGSSGIELIDLDGDGDLDVLATNGDSLDSSLIRPDHGVAWLENRGKFPFVAHRLATLFGAHRAVAADFDSDGDLDIVAVSLLPQRVFPQQKDLDAMILLEQVGSGKFVRHTLKRGGCDHATVAVGDLFDQGRSDIVTGTFTLLVPAMDAITIWRNHGKK